MKKNVKRIVALLAVACMLCTMGAAFADENAEVIYTTEAPEAVQCFQYTIPAGWAHSFNEELQLHTYFEKGPNDRTGGVIAVKEMVSNPEDVPADMAREDILKMAEDGLGSLVEQILETSSVTINELDGTLVTGSTEGKPAAALVLLRDSNAILYIGYMNFSEKMSAEQIIDEACKLFDSVFPYDAPVNAEAAA